MTSNIRLLYAEDNPQDADLTRTYFADYAPEFEVTVVGTGEACLVQVLNNPPDILLLDHNLPDTNSLELLKVLSRLETGLPVVIVTGAGDEQLVLQALHLGAINYVRKYGDYLSSLPDLLRDAIAKQLDKQNVGGLIAPKRILYVKHEAMDSDTTLQYLAKNAPYFTIDVAHSGSEGLALLSVLPVYDLVLIELCMPDQSGLVFVRQAKLNKLVFSPFIILSEGGNEETAIMSIREGAADYIIKSESYLSQLIYRIGHVINHEEISKLNERQAGEVKRQLIEENLRIHQVELEAQNFELLQIQEELASARARYYDLYDLAPVGYITVSENGLILQSNFTASRLVGVNRGALEKQFLYKFVVIDDLDVYYLLCQKMLKSNEPQVAELHLLKADGAQLWVELVATMQKNDGTQVYRIVLRDISQRKQAEEKLQLAASVFTNAREGIMITAADGTIVDVNDAFTYITSYGRDEVIGQNPRLLSSGRHDVGFYKNFWQDLLNKGHWYGEVWNRRKNNEVYAVMQTISAVRDAQGITQHYLSLFSDITQIKEHEQELEHNAHFDALTNLPNRILLADRLQQGIAQTRRRGLLLGVAFLDLDGFKAINDTYGHEAGDHLLISVANHMKLALREGDTLARMGGDEFVAELLDLENIEASAPMLARLLTAAAQPVKYGDVTLQVSASLGVTFYPQAENIDADQLLRQADQAMYQAKQAGKNRYHVFDSEQDSLVRGRYESLAQIRRALFNHEFLLYYQPNVDMRKGTVVGAEALIRWQHPEKGLLPPVAFLPVIEDHPLAVEIGEWVIETALTQLEIWQAAGLTIPVSVNVGAHQLRQVDFVDRLCHLLEKHPTVSPSMLKLEVLETSALINVTKISRVIEACRKFGVTFAMDDFGTGYSSLTYLKRLPVTRIKIDQTFVRGMLFDPDDLAILKGVLSLSAAFHREVIAEGVETIEHGAMLLQLGCDLAQGYGIARPMPANQIPEWSAAWRPDPSWQGLGALALN